MSLLLPQLSSTVFLCTVLSALVSCARVDYSDIDWDLISGRLPTEKNEIENEERDNLFMAFDVNGKFHIFHNMK